MTEEFKGPYRLQREAREKNIEYDRLCCAEEDAEREYRDLIAEMPPIKERSAEQQNLVNTAESEARIAFYRRYYFEQDIDVEVRD